MPWGRVGVAELIPYHVAPSLPQPRFVAVGFDLCDSCLTHQTTTIFLLLSMLDGTAVVTVDSTAVCLGTAPFAQLETRLLPRLTTR